MTTPLDTITREGVVTAICTVLPRVVRNEQAVATEDTRLIEDLGLSSSSTLELMLELEDALEIQINVEDIDRDDFRTVGTLASFVAGHLLTEE
jgi:acyl carrier protein